MGLFTKWQTMLAFKSIPAVTDPRILLDHFNEWSPISRCLAQFSYHVCSDGEVKGWIRFERKRDARKVLRFLFKSPLFKYVDKGQVNSACLDSIRWGISSD